MLIEEKGIIISVRKFQESSFIIKCLLEHSGLIAGLHKTRKAKHIQEPIVGNLIQAKWQARLEEHLGFLNFENVKNTASLISGKKLPVLILDSAVNLINILVAEKEPHDTLFSSLEDLLNIIEDYQDDNLEILADYIKFEVFELLGNSGFGLDLSKCVVTNSTENLTYISPRSASAVSLEIGKPYENKLFKLPKFLLPGKTKDYAINDLKEAYKISLYFLEKHLLKPFAKPLPLARRLLQEYILQLS
ncbi:hypothetical protein NF27_DP01370 [Candidatus Jidaibacter acanthamoeba]|uniref:DNA replication/recombination mediator RecO N-terminal domain-containing protein n=1 Tax=Candidatus Jidaibacter acanthamoebae TaxID=86105 RepID=A0A0C1QNI2_9RICK|nr:DNA repair protein RecO [Candidatus Jidaibacter acanthamoeba]KIE05593.1 hypothetical protein NF27_DP01370 [Candidatus Jidaibacter acanthamoeba]